MNLPWSYRGIFLIPTAAAAALRAVPPWPGVGGRLAISEQMESRTNTVHSSWFLSFCNWSGWWHEHNWWVWSGIYFQGHHSCQLIRAGKEIKAFTLICCLADTHVSTERGSKAHLCPGAIFFNADVCQEAALFHQGSVSFKKMVATTVSGHLFTHNAPGQHFGCVLFLDWRIGGSDLSSTFLVWYTIEATMFFL